MNLKEISYLINLDSPLAQAKILANHGQEITKETREINKLEKKMKNSLKKWSFCLLSRGCCCCLLFAASRLT